MISTGIQFQIFLSHVSFFTGKEEEINTRLRVRFRSHQCQAKVLDKALSKTLKVFAALFVGPLVFRIE